MKEVIGPFKDIISKVLPQVAKANITTILCSMRNPTCMAIRLRTEEMEQLLEDLMPLKDVPSGSEVASFIEGITPLTDDQRDLLTKLFDDLEVTHEHLSRSCSTLSRLSKTLNLAQLMRVLKTSTRPLIQVNTLEGFFDKPLMTSRKTDLPVDINTMVRLTMTSNPNTDDIAKEWVDSPTCLLTAMFTCKILRRFGNGTTQWDIQEEFNVRPKQLSTLLLVGSIWVAPTENH